MATRTKTDRAVPAIVLFCPGCATGPVCAKAGQGAESLCAQCHADFLRWAKTRAKLDHALVTWVRLKRLGCLP